MFCFFSLVLLFGAIGLSYAENVIVPGAPWTDTSGNSIQAHGGGILKVGSTFYWFGEDKAANSALFSAVSCYTSTDLVNWSRQNNALTPISGTMISNSNIVERPKVIFNQKNSEYVMWFHSDTSNYGAAEVGVATAKSPCGPYTYKASWKPLGADSRDMGLFLDGELHSNAYLLYASDNNVDFKIASLDSNYYNVTGVVSEITNVNLEAPGVIKRNGVYWLFASHTSGWAPNPNKYFSSNSISGPWSAEADLAPESTRTYYSQNNYDLLLPNQNAIYMGDRWHSALLGDSRYMWLPLDFSSGSPKILQADVWSVDPNSGSWTIASGTTYEAENGTRGGNSTLITNSGFSGGHGVGYLGNGGTVTLNNVQGNGVSGGQWVAVYAANGDSSYRTMTISVNGGSAIVIQQPDTGSASNPISVPVKLNLKSGSNTILFAAGQSNYAADLDKIIVYTQS
ncbi:carbohydrate-binding module family 35 protein [Sphaerobolus stellatus SS14]|uniref:Carbohydrate-binding module family 35 protein n=1 Tax=Sphaerobolus stellatus (strain SS14) TaxID=990650 RepID=A0A0C9TDY3_SPHS4|nr:carbohydrate-binding module family 35 protein [Sphaerobolus stellatus SS14]